jgi:hypothetical protein
MAAKINEKRVISEISNLVCGGENRRQRIVKSVGESGENVMAMAKAKAVAAISIGRKRRQCAEKPIYKAKKMTASKHQHGESIHSDGNIESGENASRSNENSAASANEENKQWRRFRRWRQQYRKLGGNGGEMKWRVPSWRHVAASPMAKASQ